MRTQNNLKVAFIQSDLFWENPSENRKHFETKINSISSKVDLVILPEMFSTGFTMNASKVAETMGGKTVLWMKKLAREKNCAITGSIIIKDENVTLSAVERSYYNRLLFVHPSGKIETYDKKHTFTLAGEDKVFSSGNKKIIVDYKGWKICPLICYDLRFPVWARNTKSYDLLIYVASWPKPRIEAWNTLLKARAIENMSYTVGVNRIGKDANNYEYTGSSACYDTLGNCLTETNQSEEAILIVDLDKEKQDKLRNKFQFLEDKDAFILIARR